MLGQVKGGERGDEPHHAHKNQPAIKNTSMGRRTEHAVGTSCPFVVTWHRFLPASALTLPAPFSGEHDPHALASDSSLWDMSVNVGSSIWVRFLSLFSSGPPGQSRCFCWDLPSFETLFSTPWHQPRGREGQTYQETQPRVEGKGR